MHMNDVAKYAAEKEHLMRNEGKHPANKDHFTKEKPWNWGGEYHTEAEHDKLMQEDYERDLAKGKS